MGSPASSASNPPGWPSRNWTRPLNNHINDRVLFAVAWPRWGFIMKIAKIETFRVPPRWMFVRVETDDGLVGWGEASLEGHNEAVAGAFEGVRDRLIGRDPDRIEDAWQT